MCVGSWHQKILRATRRNAVFGLATAVSLLRGLHFCRFLTLSLACMLLTKLCLELTTRETRTPPVSTPHSRDMLCLCIE